MYNPQANRVERFHRNLGTMLSINLDRDNINWVSKLATIKLAYNSKVHRSTGGTPALAFLDHEVKIPINLMIPEPDNPPLKYKWLSNLQERYSRIFAKIYANQDSVNGHNAWLYGCTATRKRSFLWGTWSGTL